MGDPCIVCLLKSAKCFADIRLIDVIFFHIKITKEEISTYTNESGILWGGMKSKLGGEFLERKFMDVEIETGPRKIGWNVWRSICVTDEITGDKTKWKRLTYFAPVKMGCGQDLWWCWSTFIRNKICQYVYFTQVILTDPHDFVETTILYEYIIPGDLVDIKVEPLIFKATSSVRRVATAKRSCWFHDEILLENIDRYSFESCHTECNIKDYLEHCGCVPYKYPRSKYNVFSLLNSFIFRVPSIKREKCNPYRITRASVCVIDIVFKIF